MEPFVKMDYISCFQNILFLCLRKEVFMKKIAQVEKAMRLNET